MKNILGRMVTLGPVEAGFQSALYEDGHEELLSIQVSRLPSHRTDAPRDVAAARLVIAKPDGPELLICTIWPNTVICDPAWGSWPDGDARRVPHAEDLIVSVVLDDERWSRLLSEVEAIPFLLEPAGAAPPAGDSGT